MSTTEERDLALRLMRVEGPNVCLRELRHLNAENKLTRKGQIILGIIEKMLEQQIIEERGK